MARIGGDHGAITAAGARLDATGEEALGAAAQASGYSAQMEAGLEELTALLTSHFEETAADLKARVSAARARLAEADWAGSSREHALAAEQALHADVDRVLDNALASVAALRTRIRGDADAFRAGVEGELRSILAAVNDAYHQAGQASRRFADNLAAADQTITFRG